ncbi:MAG TPA: acyl-CoA dehydrogenase family protein [Sandaracinaceae bacterium LLY-WYZ-13_1]|nr:acyl-CoA dehydrogenase family protein [Sandaracinaceae bacterium LLY-WYZ-13_1]
MSEGLIGTARALAEELAPRAEAIEAARRVPAELSERLGREGFHRLLVPEALGGREVHPAVFASVLEALAHGDAATAWVVMTSSTTGILLAYLDVGVARAILDDAPHAALAGVFAPSGRATPTEGGYRLSGRWRYGSGCENAAWRMGGALVFEGDAPRTVDGGGPEIRSCFFRADESRVVDTWDVSGLRGTGSHDLEVQDVLVPAERTTCVRLDHPRHEGPLYRFPLFGLLATGVSAVGLGIARRALDEVEAQAKASRSRGGSKRMAESELVQVRVASAEAELAAARALTYETLESVYEHAASGEPLAGGDRARLRMAATHAAGASARVVDACYHLAGGAAIWASSPLQRCLRDVHVMTQHVMVAEPTLKPVGRLLLDLPTDTSML